MDCVVSIIMPAFNVEKYVGEAVDSILNQTYEYWELIAVDDGSTDATGEILDRFAKKDSRIRTVHTENGGVSRARNAGLDLAQGEWIFFMDSDDLLPQDALEKLTVNAEDYDVVIGDYIFYPDRTEKSKLADKCYGSREEIRADFGELFTGSYLSTVWGKLFKRDSLMERFNEEYRASEDVLFLSQVLPATRKIRTIGDVVYLYRKNEGSITHKWLEYGYHPEKVEGIIDNFLNAFGEEAAVRKLLYSYYIHHAVMYVKAVVDCADYDKEQKDALIGRIFCGRYFKNIPLGRYNLPAKELRLWMVLKTEDLGLILAEFAS